MDKVMGVNALVLSIVGTESAQIAAACLAILAAMLHAVFAAL